MRANCIGDIVANQSTNEKVPWYQQILNALPGLATTYLSIEQQRDLQRLNLQRAAQQLPPLSIDDYAPQVQAGLTKSTQNTVLLVAAGIGGALVLSALLKGNRRR